MSSYEFVYAKSEAEQQAARAPRQLSLLALGLISIGSLLWICASPLRPQHRRKNWFFGGHRFAAPPADLESEIRFETLRASGPGGQHVNTTASAVRATHVASGISVKVQDGRSQHANRRLAIALIGQRLQEQAEARADAQRAQRRQAHYDVDRGNPRRVFRGAAFVPD